MKTLKRVKLNQLNGIQDISMDEMMQILGGKGCCWEVLAKLYKETHSEYLEDPELKNIPYFSASSFESMWRTYMGDECAPNGDPMNYQASDLFNFIQELPHLRTTTENGFESNGYGRMMSISGYHNGCNQQLGFALIDGNGDDMHAVMITNYNENTGIYTCWNPDTGREFPCTESAFISATGIYRDDNKGRGRDNNNQ